MKKLKLKFFQFCTFGATLGHKISRFPVKGVVIEKIAIQKPFSLAVCQRLTLAFDGPIIKQRTSFFCFLEV